MKQSIYQLFVPLFFLLVKTQETTKNVNADYTDYTFSNPDQCTLIQADPGKPNPSLVQCYRNNPKACCNSASDEYVKNQYSDFLSSSCYRKFPELEAYFCYGCSPTEFQSTNRTNRTILICSDLANRIWGGDLERNTTKFDQCGMKSFWKASENITVFLPSYVWDNITEFFKDVKPPLFEDYTIQVGDWGDCYDGAQLMKFKSFLLLLVLVVTFFLIV